MEKFKIKKFSRDISELEQLKPALTAKNMHKKNTDIESVPDVSEKEYCNKLIEQGDFKNLMRIKKYSLIYQNMESFPGLDANLLVKEMIDNGDLDDFGLYFLKMDLEPINFTLQKEVFEVGIKCISSFHPAQYGFITNINHFDGLNYQDYQRFVTVIFDQKSPELCMNLFCVIKHIKGIDYNDALKKYIEITLEADHFAFYNINISQFPSVLSQDSAQVLIDVGLAYKVMQNINKFPGIDYKKIIEAVIETDSANSYFNRYKDFPYVDLNEMILRAIKSGHTRMLIFSLDQMTELNINVAKEMIKNGFVEYVIRYSYAFKNPLKIRYLSRLYKFNPFLKYYEE